MVRIIIWERQHVLVRYWENINLNFDFEKQKKRKTNKKEV